ncbi:NACHT domain-containing protein [Streptomyces sp. LX-29]|uniref:NACHT domain-containing protein n=1 Tax=Streptomyces sp. LX-29 TaxID=2900152 RepID=UPI00240DF1FC|nr:NACHT domain-containing protein [Streptomyces sp. LX-29]WFB05733.1 NACHT domain-containing protein [Streptomyces sp. LX-29]
MTRTRRLYVLLTLGGLVAAVCLAYSAGELAAALPALPPTVAGAFLTWAAFSGDRIEGARRELPSAAQELAGAVRQQWDAELSRQRLVRPIPPAVSWAAAAQELSVPWSELVAAARRWPGGPPSDPAGWPAGPAGLAGQEEEITETYLRRIPTRRLVLLGEPGSGKTTLLIRLLLGMIKQRAPDDRVPVLFTVASLDPRPGAGDGWDDTLYAWMAGQLERDHEILADPAPPGFGEVSLARALLNRGMIIPIFDGFDELPTEQRRRAMVLVNESLPLDQPVVLSCRSAEYRALLEVSAPLGEAATLELLPLHSGEVEEYLRATALGHGPRTTAASAAVEERWGPVLERLGGTSPLARTLATPLGVFLARAVYHPDEAPSSRAPSPRDEPRELLTFATREAVERHLFRAFIRTAYRPAPQRGRRWTDVEAERVFVFLARHMKVHLDGSTEIAWWELYRAMPAAPLRLLVSVGAGALVAVVPWCVAGPVAGLGAGLTVGPVALLATGQRREPAAGIRWSWRHSTLVPGTVAGMVTGFAIGPVTGLRLALVCVLAIGFAVGLMTGLRPKAMDVTAGSGPGESLSRDRGTAWRIMLLWALAAGPVAGLVADLVAGRTAAVVATPVVGVAIGLAVGFGGTAWGLFTLARGYLFVRERLPGDLMAFLDDAHRQRGVLRKTGAVYQFRHINLQRHLEE